MKKINCFFLVFLVLFFLPMTIHANYRYVRDDGDLLSAEEEKRLEEQLTSLSARWGMDVVIWISDSLAGRSPQDSADLYLEENYRYDSVVLLTVLDIRRLQVSTSGKAIDVFTDYGIQQLLEKIRPYLQSGQYYEAYTQYASLTEYYLQQEREGHPVDVSEDIFTEIGDAFHPKNPLSWGMALLMSFLGSLGITIFDVRRLKSVRRQTNARNYCKENSFHLHRSEDHFLYQNVHRTKIEKNHSGGGSSLHRSSSGRMHGGGGMHF